MRGIGLLIGIAAVLAGSYMKVKGICKRDRGIRTKKFIPSVLCFTAAVNSIYLLAYGWDAGKATGRRSIYGII